MATTDSLLVVNLQTLGSNNNTWGTGAGGINESLQKLDRAIADVRSVSVAGGSNVALTQTQSESMVLIFTGTLTADINVTPVADKEKIWLVHNNTSGAYTLTFITSAGTGIVVKQGTKAILYCDGTDIFELTPALWDADRDTGFQVEEGADDDTLRGDALGSQVFAFTQTSLVFSPSGTTALTIAGSLITTAVDLLVQEANDGADTGLTIDNSAGSGSTDETASLLFNHAGQVGGAIRSVRIGDYSSAANRDSAIVFAPSDGGTNTERMRLDNNGQLFLGETANANNTAGITINVGSATDETLSCKSSSVAHGMTSVTETDTWAYIGQQNSTLGGLFIGALAEAARADHALQVVAYGDGGGLTATKTTAGGDGGITMYYFGHDGANAFEALVANGNVFSVRTASDGATTDTKFIVDAEGDLHVDGSTSLTAFDAYDDVALCRAFDMIRTPGQIIRHEWDKYVGYNFDSLIEAGILGRITPLERAMGSRPLLNVTQLQRLHNGAIVQLGQRQWEMRREFEDFRDNPLKYIAKALWKQCHSIAFGRRRDWLATR